MDLVQVPVLSLEAPLREAFDKMKQSRRSAVIGASAAGACLFRAGPVVQAIAAGKLLLAEVQVFQKVHLASAEEARNEDLGLVGVLEPPPPLNYYRPWEAQLERFLDRQGVQYLLAAAGDPTVLALRGLAAVHVITRHEGLALGIGSGPADCYCTNPQQGDDPHGYSSPLPADGMCVFDRWPIVCS